jgi:hypothetical protein
MKRALLATMFVLASAALAYGQAGDDSKTSNRVVIDRVALEPSALTGYNLRIYLSALSLNGQQLDLTTAKGEAKSLKLYVGAGEKKIPYTIGAYEATDSDTAMVVLVQASLDYTEALPHIQESLDRDLLGALPDHTQIAVLTFGDTTASGKLASIKSVRGRLLLSGDNSAGDPALSDSLDRALLLLRKAKTEPEGKPIRKMIVVIGDGRDMAADNDRITRAGKRAAKDGVRIHTIAYSANDIRRPMLALGELSKQSLGTFRWVRNAGIDSWKAAFEQLRDEISKQYVVTYFVDPGEEIAGRKMHIVTTRTNAESNEVKIPEPACGPNPCTSGYCHIDKCLAFKSDNGRGILGWLLLIGGIVVGGFVVLLAIGFVITKIQEKKGQPKAPNAPTGHPAAPPPGFLPNGRPMPALMIMSGPRTGERHMLFNGFLIGKQPGCTLIIEDGYTSSQHAQIGMDAMGNCKIYDRGSTNGTYVNGVRVAESALTHGITFRIGSTEMRFLAE